MLCVHDFALGLGMFCEGEYVRGMGGGLGSEAFVLYRDLVCVGYMTLVSTVSCSVMCICMS